jgi:transcriptional regulator with XRE-family HTH domain
MPVKTGRKDDLRQQIVEWMLAVMRERDWSAERWAALAGTSPTNITRLISGGESLPTTATLAKLARAAGSQPSLLGRPLTRADFKAVPCRIRTLPPPSRR